MGSVLRIGVSANFFHPDPARPVYKGKTLLYAEESLLHWIAGSGAVPYLIPRLPHGIDLHDVFAGLAGIVFSGGADICPGSYGETPIKSEWSGDYDRDQYEIELFHTALDLGIPVLGICRGHQLINVALGGTMYQDTATQKDGAQLHRSWEVYDELKHEIEIAPHSVLAGIFPGRRTGLVNSIHHQAIKDLGASLVVQATSIPDGLVESIWLDRPGHYVLGVQWHPEWRRDTEILDSDFLLQDFLSAVRKYAGRGLDKLLQLA